MIGMIHSTFFPFEELFPVSRLVPLWFPVCFFLSFFSAKVLLQNAISPFDMACDHDLFPTNLDHICDTLTCDLGQSLFIKSTYHFVVVDT